MANRSSIRLEERIADALFQAEFSFRREVAIRNLVVDFLVRHKRSRVVLEAKTWLPTDENLVRAHEQARYVQEITGVDRVLVVVEGLDRANLELDAVPEGGLIPILRDVSAQAAARKPRAREPLREARESAVVDKVGDGPKAVRTPSTPRKRVFAAMPLDRAYDDVFYVAIVGAARRVRADAGRIDQDYFTGDIVDRIKARITSADAVVADVSGSRPSVLFEIGYAEGRGVDVVQIAHTPMADLPFDIRNNQTLRYEQGCLHAFTTTLATALKDIL
jgi:hypothetical protein